MALLNQSIQVYGQLPKFLEALRAGTAPQTFTRQFLKDLNFKSSNHHQFIPLLKGLGFLTESGAPTTRYKEFLDASRWKKVLAVAVREAYGDIFVLKAKPSDADLQMIAGKYKSTYNLSDVSAERAAKTFLALLSLSDQDVVYGKNTEMAPHPAKKETMADDMEQIGSRLAPVAVQNLDAKAAVGLHYNIQIHLPATKDIEVYNAIFKSLREHIID